MTLLAHFTVAKGKILALSAFVISKHINHHLLQSLRPLSDELDERVLIFVPLEAMNNQLFQVLETFNRERLLPELETDLSSRLFDFH
jgi:hypothetical protein